MKDNNQIKEMIESAPSKREAMNMLNTWYSFGSITEEQSNEGKELIKIEFKTK